MEGSAAARGEGSSEEKKETATPEERASALCPPISSPIRSPISSPISAEDEERKDYEDRGNSIAIKQDNSSATITTARPTQLEPSEEDQYTMIMAMMREKAESILQLRRRTPTTQVEVPPSGESALKDGSEVPAAQPKVSLFPHRNKKRAIRPKNFSLAPNANTTDEVAESQLGDELDQNHN
jgi:hypothetical protein